MARRCGRYPLRRSRRLAGLGPGTDSGQEQSNWQREFTNGIQNAGAIEPSVAITVYSEQSGSGEQHLTDVLRLSSVGCQRRSDGTSSALRVGSPNFRLHSGSSSSSSACHGTVHVPPDDGPSTSSSSGSSSSTAAVSSSEDRASGSQGARGRRGVTGVHRRPGHSSLLRSYTEHLGAVPVQGESFCRCPQQGQSRDLHCSCGEEDQCKS
jgi:hypothetical protein